MGVATRGCCTHQMKGLEKLMCFATKILKIGPKLRKLWHWQWNCPETLIADIISALTNSLRGVSVTTPSISVRFSKSWGQETVSVCPGDVPRYPKEVSAKKMDRKNLNLKNLSQISETSPVVWRSVLDLVLSRSSSWRHLNEGEKLNPLP